MRFLRMTPKKGTARRRRSFGVRRGILVQTKSCALQEYFVYFKKRKRTAVPKGPTTADELLQGMSPIKREQGESPSPCVNSHFARSDSFQPIGLRSGRQNLAALCTTAGQNLAAVGSGHSLTETVDLGTMTTAGLIGTLHVVYTSLKSLMLDSRNRPQQHIIRDYK